MISIIVISFLLFSSTSCKNPTEQAHIIIKYLYCDECIDADLALQLEGARLCVKNKLVALDTIGQTSKNKSLKASACVEDVFHQLYPKLINEQFFPSLMNGIKSCDFNEQLVDRLEERCAHEEGNSGEPGVTGEDEVKPRSIWWGVLVGLIDALWHLSDD